MNRLSPLIRCPTAASKDFTKRSDKEPDAQATLGMAETLMAMLRSIVHDKVDRTAMITPAVLLDHAESRLRALGLAQRGAFITAFCGVLDPSRIGLDNDARIRAGDPGHVVLDRGQRRQNNIILILKPVGPLGFQGADDRKG